MSNYRKYFGQKNITRRSFLKISFLFISYYLTRALFPKSISAKENTSGPRPKSNIKGDYDLVLAEGDNSYQNTVKAIKAIGGMERFVRKNSVVVIKPNIGWDRTPEQAANTDPFVVACLVELAYKAGARRVNVFDNPCNDARRCYLNSGIKKHVEEKGGYVYFPDDWNTVKAKFNYKSPMEGWPIYRDALECGTFINVPVLKHHGLTGLTLSMKNLMGVCSGVRGEIHDGIGKKLADLTDFINPDLTVIDAHRVLIRNGPSGGRLEDVITLNKLIVSTDPTLADAYAAKILDIDPLSIPYIKEAVLKNFGTIDFDKANILKISV